MAATLSHPTLGQIEGVKPDDHPAIKQYLGIQYATLANRFARGAVVETPGAGTINATKTGPLPVANPKNCDEEHLMLQHALPHPDYEFSDTECLTLNVTVPAGATATAGLPVVVLMHGGGFVTGSANWPQYSLARLVERSVEAGQPIVGVSINYRLGPFGFLSSAALRDAGFKPNNGLDDQKLGLRWVQKHVAGFGGDPAQVTYVGSSIGAASGFFHLQSAEPLFARLVALGGSPLLQPVPEFVGEIAYGIVTGALGLADLAPAEQVQALLSTPAAELSARLQGVPFPVSAIIDGDVVKAAPSYAGLAKPGGVEALFPGAKWCKAVWLGDCQLDGMIMAILALANRADNPAASLKKYFELTFPDDPAKVTALLQGFGIDESNKDNVPVLGFVNDISFAAAARATAAAWAAQAGATSSGSKAYLSHLNAPNPWPGAWRGHATHVFDVVLLLGNYDAFLGAGQRALGERMARDLVAYAHGRDPFPAHGDGSASSSGGAKLSQVYFAGADDDKDGSYVASEADGARTGRRSVLEDVAAGDAEVLDKLLGVFGQFLQGPPK